MLLTMLLVSAALFSLVSLALSVNVRLHRANRDATKAMTARAREVLRPPAP